MNDMTATQFKSGPPDTSPMNLNCTTAAGADTDNATTTYTIVMAGPGSANPVTPNGSTQIYPPPGVTVGEYTLTGVGPNGHDVPPGFKLNGAGVLVYSTP